MRFLITRFCILLCLLFPALASSVTPMVAAGMVHNVAVKADGTVLAWGNNDTGQLGNGTWSTQYSPVAVPGLTGVVAVAAGLWHSVALKGDGTVWAWGWNSAGQLGNGTTTDRWSPGVVPGLTGVVAVAAGHQHTIALKGDGTVWAWGNNDYGQLGNGTTTQRTIPVAVPGLNGVLALAAGVFHSVALKADGTVLAWGSNDQGQLGNGTWSTQYSPVAVPGLTTVLAVAAGSYHSFALKADGTLWAWGYNGSGQLGNGTTTDRTSPVAVFGLTTVKAVAAGSYHTVAVKADGTVLAWGSNDDGQLGNGTWSTQFSPVAVPELTGVVAVAAGYQHSVALKADGTLWTWGNNVDGQLGDGTGITRNSSVSARFNGDTPVAATVPGAVTSLMATAGDTRATLAFAAPLTGGVVTSYRASCTANGAMTQNGTAAASPITITGLVNGTIYSCAVWAINSNGDGPESSISVTPVAPPPSTGCFPLSNINESTSAEAHSGSVTVTSGGVNAQGEPCGAFFVQSNDPSWITVGTTTAAPGSVTNFVVSYSVSAYSGTSLRTGTLSIGEAPNTRTYTIVQYGSNGMPAPTCTLTASPAAILNGSSSTLTASCTPAATSYVWTGGSCEGTTAASCTVTPAASTAYTVAGTNSVGTGQAASATVSVATNLGVVTGTPITRYRLYNDGTKEHLYTTDLNEYNVLSAGGNWVGEGPIYMLFQGHGALSGVPAVPYYRLFNPSSGLHHWTTDANENTVLATMGWNQEGIDGYIMPTAVTGTLPLYRLYLNAFGGLHLWTMDANERTVLTTTAGWVDEGIAGYVIPMP